MTAQQINLVDGPSKFDLMLALFDKGSNRKVVFTAADGKKYESSINMVQAEDGSGECWNIEGSTTAATVSRVRYHFRGFFRTSIRSGYFKFI